MKPHKHAEIIRAWADGAEIEFRFKDAIQGWSDWRLNDGRFSTDPWWEYRIKQVPKPDFNQTMDVYMNKMYEHFPSGFRERHNMIGEFLLLGTMNLTFDGTTGKLKSAEVL